MKIKALTTVAFLAAILLASPAQSAKVHEPMSMGELRIKIARLHVGKERCSKEHLDFLMQNLQYHRHEGKLLKEHEYVDLSKKIEHFKELCKKAGFH